MAIDIKQLLALLQQGAPQQGAVKPPMVGDPPPAPPMAKPPGMPPLKTPNSAEALDFLNNFKPSEPSLGSFPAPVPEMGELKKKVLGPNPPVQKTNKEILAGGGGTDWGVLEEALSGASRGMEIPFMGSGPKVFPPSGKPPVEQPAATPEAGMGAQVVGPIDSMFTDAASEVVQKGADNPDKADDLLRSEFHDDPEIEDAIAQARQRYAVAQARSAKPPGVMEYVGYVLSTLAGANPMQAAEAISRRGEKRQDEQMALQDLLGAQGMKIKDRQMQRQEAGQQGIALERLMQQQQEGALKAQSHAEDKNFDRLKAGRGAALQRMNQLQQAVQYANNPSEKKALQAELDQLKRRTQFFGRQLGEPEQDEQGRPIGMASPDAMRLLGLG